MAKRIQAHVKAMYERLKNKQVTRPTDPLLVAVFENADKIDAVVTDLPDGVKVVETSQDAYPATFLPWHLFPARRSCHCDGCRRN